MFKILIVEVITKHDSPFLPYLNANKMLHSAYMIIKTKVTRDRSRYIKVFSEKGIFENLTKFTENCLC